MTAQTNELAEELGIPSNKLTNLYFNCMDMVETTWQQLTSPEPNQAVPEGAEENPLPEGAVAQAAPTNAE